MVLLPLLIKELMGGGHCSRGGMWYNTTARRDVVCTTINHDSDQPRIIDSDMRDAPAEIHAGIAN